MKTAGKSVKRKEKKIKKVKKNIIDAFWQQLFISFIVVIFEHKILALKC
jgi:hypothetical protein